MRDVKVMCPMNRGGMGARALNVELQQALNPPGEHRVERFGWTFCPGDKVMQVTNDCRNTWVSRTTGTAPEVMMSASTWPGPNVRQLVDVAHHQ